MTANADSIPTLAFTSTWQQYAIGTLTPGAQARIAYDSNRLPNERSTYNGGVTWSIIAYYRFAPDAPIQSSVLAFTPAGMVPGPAQTISDGSSFMYATIDVPDDAQSIEMWFLNTGRSGWRFWDSDYGQNYSFRFTAQDIGPILANVVTSPPTPYSGFQVQLNSVNPDVTSMAVDYRITNLPPDAASSGGTIPLQMLTIERGFAVWANGTTAVALRANILFTISYTIGNQSYVALNDGAGYTAIGQPAAEATSEPTANAVPPPQTDAPRLQV